LNFHSFIFSDVQMILPLIPKWEYWNQQALKRGEFYGAWRHD